MKRNLLLLTAVVLVAILLSGCSLFPWNWGKVDVTYSFANEIKEDFEKEHKNPKEVSKNGKFEVEFFFVDSEIKKYDKDNTPDADKQYKATAEDGKKNGSEAGKVKWITGPKKGQAETDKTEWLLGIKFDVTSGRHDIKVEVKSAA